MSIKTIQPAGRFRLQVEFDDGARGVVDLGDLQGQGVFAAWDADGAFEDVSIGSGGEVVWACGVDYCADALYLRLTKKSPRDILPGLRAESRVA